jgi:hypothetical protein
MCHNRTSKQEASTIFQVEQVHNKSTRVLICQLPAASTMSCIVSTHHPAARALCQLCRAQRPCLYRASGCMVSPLGLLSGCTSSTSIVLCTATTRLPATAALHQLCRAPRLLGRTGSTSTMSCVWLRRLVTRLVVDYFASRRLVVDYFAHAARLGTSRCLSRRLIIDYFAHAARLGASTRCEARCAARCQLLCLAHARRDIVDYFTHTARSGASARRAVRRAARHRLLRIAQVRRRLLRPRRASRCLDTSRGSSSTTSPTPRVRVPRHVARLVVDYFARLVVDFFAYSARLGVLRLAQARRRLLHLRRASGCLGTSRGSSSTSSTTPRVRVPRHVARLITRLVASLVVDYFDYVARPGASARHAACRTVRRQLRLRRASGCLGTSRGSSRRSSSTTSPTSHIRVP